MENKNSIITNTSKNNEKKNTQDINFQKIKSDKVLAVTGKKMRSIILIIILKKLIKEKNLHLFRTLILFLKFKLKIIKVLFEL